MAPALLERGRCKALNARSARHHENGWLVFLARVSTFLFVVGNHKETRSHFGGRGGGPENETHSNQTTEKKRKNEEKRKVFEAGTLRRYIHSIQAGIRHIWLPFEDGGCPSVEIILRFLKAVESAPGAFAVHCRSGLGRTATQLGERRSGARGAVGRGPRWIRS